jgi:uncharacterized membrane protein YkvA (DUF1232 family)
MPPEKQFIDRMRELLVNLPYDMKVLFEAISDEDLPKEAREIATSGVLYCLSPADPIPDNTGLVGFVDDAIAVRLVLSQLLDLGGEAIAEYPERFPEQFAGLDDDLTLFRGFLGEDMSWLERRMSPGFVKQVKYKGKTIPHYVEDDEASQWLYEEGLEFTTEYEIDDAAASRLTSARVITDAFRKRRQFEDSRRSG